MLIGYKNQFLQHVTAQDKIHYTYNWGVLSKFLSNTKMLAAQIFSRQEAAFHLSRHFDRKKIQNMGET